MATRARVLTAAVFVVSAGVIGSAMSTAWGRGPADVLGTQVQAASPRKPGKIVFDRYLGGSGDSERKAIYVIRSNGNGLRKLTNGREPEYSPDGERIVFARRGKGGLQSLYVMRANGTRVRRLTRASSLDNNPAWSPDGKQIVFARGRKGKGVWPPEPSDIYTMKANGTKVRRLTRTPEHDDLPVWFPNGKRIFYTTVSGTCCSTIKPNGKGRRHTDREIDDWSPNGRWVVFDRDMQVWIMTARGKRQRAIGPGRGLDANAPAWSPDGKQIVFVGFHPVGGTGAGGIGIFKMNADGSRVVQLTAGGKQGDFGLNDAFPDWQPR